MKAAPATQVMITSKIAQNVRIKKNSKILIASINVIWVIMKIPIMNVLIAIHHALNVLDPLRKNVLNANLVSTLKILHSAFLAIMHVKHVGVQVNSIVLNVQTVNNDNNNL